MQQSFDPTRTKEEFAMDKRNIEIPARRAIKELKDGDIEKTRKDLDQTRIATTALGDPLKQTFIPKNIREQNDPSGTILGPMTVADPRIMDKYFLPIARMEVALIGK